jgi:hypothetical protein
VRPLFLHFLIKGARTFQFEEIVSPKRKTHETVLEINLNAQHPKPKLKPNVKIMVMVKAFDMVMAALKLQNC